MRNRQYNGDNILQLCGDGKVQINNKDSVRAGVNRYTGMSYLYYTECRIDIIEDREEWERMRGGGKGG